MASREALAFITKCHDNGPNPRPACSPHVLAEELLGMAESACAPFGFGIGADTRAVEAFVLLQNAPNGLLAGCVLQNMANASNSHGEIASLAHRVHAWQLGKGRLADNHSLLYRRLLEASGYDLPLVSSPRLFDSAPFLSSSWTLAAYRLSLSVFPDRHWPEILGAALFEVAAPMSSWIAMGAEAGSIAKSRYVLARFGDGRLDAIDALKKAIGRVLDQLSLTSEPESTSAHQAVSGIARGFVVSLRLLSLWQDEVIHHIEAGGLSPAHAMVDLVRRKGMHAAGYHGRLRLAGKTFDERIVDDPAGFVSDLACSPWVVPGNPECSPLLRKLIAFGGPMFRVFSEQEVETIHAWIKSLAVEAAAPLPGPALKPVEHRLDTTPIEQATASDEVRDAKLSPRDLFHRLMNPEWNDDAQKQALAFASRWLARAKAVLHRRPDPLPFDSYTHQRFRRWFADRSAAQVRAYGGPQRAVTKSREAVIDEAVQLCPTILVDGAWLQRWTNAGLAETSIGAILYKIFSDEIGNGDTVQNHPNIYRRLMHQMGVKLHDVRSAEFAHDPLFDDAAFEVPAFWLSVSMFPSRFLPETLGLNLAMELSGVGGAYRTARDELAHYGFDTLFVDLHNTIDNVSTGHSAMAVEAIELLMDEAMASHDALHVSESWQRVWTGFLSLSPPKVGWKELFVAPRYRAGRPLPTR
ncbi:hypothetical protein GCM10023165_50000 [Variovorax defluvii]|uniref:Iron-containing redox enzyme family protein n=2 Tax=Variovorax defluvii TaxID=913761 RepID=A0ABP8IDK4_9BURK